MTDIAERYIRLAHAIDAHSEGFIDGYGGPPEWAVREARDPHALMAEASALLADVAGVPEEARRVILYGTEGRPVTLRFVDGRKSYEVKKPFEGVITNMDRRHTETERDWAREKQRTMRQHNRNA